MLDLKKIISSIADAGQKIFKKPKIKSNDLDTFITHPALADVCEILARITQQRFREVRVLIKQCDLESVRPAIMMMQVYSHIFKKLTS